MTPDKPAKTILVVEDEPDTSIFLSNLLTANGFCPVCAATLAEGLKKAADACPDLIIINAMLPGEAGIRLYQSLRTNHRLCHIPVIMLSGVAKRTFLRSQKALTEFGDKPVPEPENYLEKPIEPEELAREIKKLLG